MGQQLLLTRHADNLPLKAVMLNVGEKWYSFCDPEGHASERVIGQNALLQMAEHCFSMGDVAHRLKNFALWDGAFDRTPVGNIKMRSQPMQDAMRKLTQQLDEVLRIERLLTSFDIRTPLYVAARQKDDGYGSLIDGHELQADGKRLLADVRTAQARYTQLPELLGFGTDNKNRRALARTRCGKLARWLLWPKRDNPLGSRWPLNCAGYELKPLHLTGLKWHNDPDGGARRESIDHLFEFSGSPVLTEAKTRKDCGRTATSKALSQILYYGSTMANRPQLRRLRNRFPEVKCDEEARPWLALLIEDRKLNGFETDWRQVLDFARHPAVKDELGQWFAGLFQIKIQGNEEGTDWKTIEEHRIDWP